MNIPSIKILSPDLQLLNEIDIYTSLQLTRSWQGIGSFELHLIGSQKNIAVGNLIMLGSDRHRAGVIRSITKTVDANGISITVTGQTLYGFTAQRVIIPSTNSKNGGYLALPSATSSNKTLPAETIIKVFAGVCLGSDTSRPSYHALDANRRMGIHIAVTKNRGLQTNWPARYDLLNEVLQSVSEYCDCGWEIYIDLKNRRLIFDYVSGVDRSVNQSENSRVILSSDYESIDSLTYYGKKLSAKSLKQMMNRWRYSLEEQGVQFKSRRSNGQRLVDISYSSDRDGSAVNDVKTLGGDFSVPCVTCAPVSERVPISARFTDETKKYPTAD